MNTELLNRAIENAGPMSEAQRRAMWAKRGNPAAGAARAAPRAPVQSMPVRGRPVGVLPGERNGMPRGPAADGAVAMPITKPTPRPIPTKPIDQIRQPPANTPPTGMRGWGEVRPGEMYPQVEGPGNPSWERRHPERAPGGLPAERPRGYTPPIIPQDPRGVPGRQYLGGSANFDERTGRYVTQPSPPASAAQPFRPALPHTPIDQGGVTVPRAPIDGGGIALPRRDLDPKVRQAIAGLQNMLDRLRGFST